MKCSLLNDATSGMWLPQFGEFQFSAPNTIRVQSGSAVNDLFHAEVHHDRVLSADFTYSATITADWTRPDLCAHCSSGSPTRAAMAFACRLGRLRFIDSGSKSAAAPTTLRSSRTVRCGRYLIGVWGGHLTGHQIGEQVGLLCLPVPGTTFIDVTTDEIANLLFSFDDINTAPWAQVARAATEIAAKHGVGAGFFTGHQVSGKHGWIGIDARLVEVFDIDDRTVAESAWAFTDINTVGWAQASRLATDICIQFGFAGGFFTGHQLPNKRQIAALRHT